MSMLRANLLQFSQRRDAVHRRLCQLRGELLNLPLHSLSLLLLWLLLLRLR